MRATSLDRLDYDNALGNNNVFLKDDGDHAKMQNESVLCVSETR